MTERVWTVESRAGRVPTVHIRLPNRCSSYEQKFLLRSDVHFDSTSSRSDMEIRHLEEVLSSCSGILDFGDLFDVMQSPFDKRQSKSDLRQEHKRSDYFNSLIDTAVNRYAKYADCFVMMSPGNHETKMLSRASVDLTAWLVQRLQSDYKSPVVLNGYSGWVRFVIHRDNERHTRKLWYTHGYGGGGEVTKNVIQLSNRVPVYIEGADIYVCGHTHNQWWMTYPRLRLVKDGVVETRDCHFVQLPTYKDEYRDGRGGFAVESGHSPRPLGAWWLVFQYSYHSGIHIDFRRAV